MKSNCVGSRGLAGTILSPPVAPPRSKPLGGPLKRSLDVFTAGLALVLLSPLLALISIVIKATTGGPVLFRHTRIGLNGQSFGCLKFRTMLLNGDAILDQHLRINPDAALELQRYQKLHRDPRVTGLGRFLRKTSLDELPQLFNILGGDMSCVGPRPIVASELERYGVYSAYYLSTRPGLTGRWQIGGRSLTTYEQRVQFDVEYVRGWSLFADVMILLQTIPAVLKLRQAA